MPSLYSCKSSYPVPNAQQNLMGRTHYVDPETLRYHKARILSARANHDGLLFMLVESVAIDPDNRKRGFRFVVFDIFGTVIERAKLEDTYRSQEKAAKAMWDYLGTIDPVAITRAAIEREERHHANEMDYLRADLEKIEARAKGEPA